MHEQIGLLRLNHSEKPTGKSSPEQNRHIYTKILQNSTSSILSARTSKTNSKTPYELNILQDQRPKLENRPGGAEKDFKSIYGSNQLTASIDLKTLNFKNFQETSSNNVNNNSADNSRNMRKSLENLNIYTQKPKDKGDKYTELKQSIMSQIKMQNFTGVEENKPSSRENSKSHNNATAASVLSTHKSALNYFSMNQNNKNIKTGAPNQEKPQQTTQTLASNKAFKKLAGQFENAGSPDKRPEVTTSSSNSNNNNNWGRNNSHRKEKEKKPENQTHLHSNKAAKLVEKYYETLEKSHRKPAQSGSSKDVASHSFQQGSQNNKSRNPENLNVSDNSVPNSNTAAGNKGLEGSMVEPNLFDFTLLKSYNEKLSKNHSIEEQEFIRENIKKALADTPPKKRDAARSLPATTKNSNTVNFKGSLLNEAALNNRAYNLLKSRREEEAKTNDTGFRNNDAAFPRNTVETNKNIIEQQQKGGPTVKVNDLLNEEFKTNSEMRVKCEKARCEECEIKIAELEAIYEKVKGMFETHRRKETGWLSEKNHYIRQIEYLNSVIKQIIEKNPNGF